MCTAAFFFQLLVSLLAVVVIIVATARFAVVAVINPLTSNTSRTLQLCVVIFTRPSNMSSRNHTTFEKKNYLFFFPFCLEEDLLRFAWNSIILRKGERHLRQSRRIAGSFFETERSSEFLHALTFFILDRRQSWTMTIRRKKKTNAFSPCFDRDIRFFFFRLPATFVVIRMHTDTGA